MRHKVILAGGDSHFPEQDVSAVAIFERAAAHYKPQLIIHGGDLISCNALTSHAINDASYKAGEDLYDAEFSPALRHLVKLGKHSDVVFLEGNHEQRIERFLCNNGPKGAALRKLISPRRLFPSKFQTATGKTLKYVQYSGYKNHCDSFFKLSDKLIACHGWSVNKHVACKHLELSKGVSVIFHHAHRAQRHTDRNPWTGEAVEASCAGCMCSLQPTYEVGGCPTAWTHGFHVIYMRGDKHTILPVKIENNEAVLPDGTLIKA